MATVTQLLEETPSKKPSKMEVVTPKPGIFMASSLPPSVTKILPGRGGTKTPAPASASSPKDISTVDVIWAMLNDLTGKDKMAKVAQYSLRLIVHHAGKTQTHWSDDVVNIKSISDTYASSDKVLDLLVNFAKNPRAFAQVLVILICAQFSQRLSGFVPALGLYRQLLRFGKSPFRLHSLFEKVRKNMYKDVPGEAWKISDKFFTKSTLGECIGLYYSVNDDIGLLYKVKALNNNSLRMFAARHESYAWYCDSWFALYNAYNNLQKYSQQEFEMKIAIQVKKRSRTISRQVLGGSSLPINGHSDDDARDLQVLKDIQFRITNARLDIYKTISDIIFNSYTVFNAKLHFDTVQMWMGISASALATVKLFREKRKALAGI